LEGLVLPCWVGADESLIGGVMGARFLQENPNPKHVIYTQGTPGHAGQEQRAQGFFDAMPGGTKTTNLATGIEEAGFKDIVRSFLVANPDVDAIFTFTMCNKWVSDVVQDLERQDIALLTADASPSSIEGIMQGHYLATFGQELIIQGGLALHILYLYKESGVAPINPIVTGPLVIDADTAQMFKDQIIDVLGQDYYDQNNPY
jgi:ABC-type sugar transport system substrate-binding protein